MHRGVFALLVLASMASACGSSNGDSATAIDAGDDDATSAVKDASTVVTDAGHDATDAKSTDADAGVDAADAADANLNFLCASAHGPETECNCAVDVVPVPGPRVYSCPEVPVPYLCIAFDDGDTHECECRVKCGMETGGGAPNICACGAATNLVFGEPGSTQTSVAMCNVGKCCRGEGACDCSDSPTFNCTANQTVVASCTPADYDEATAMNAAFPPGSYQNVTKVDRCK